MALSTFYTLKENTMQTSTEKVTYESHITVDGSRDGMIPFIDLIADKSKVFIEECVYDTNEHLDAHWMNIEKGSISSE